MLRRIVLPSLLAAAGILLAWRMRFVQDDAFISFQYARSLAEGHGLTWFGQRVEGYTNFLWVLWMALGTKLGTDVIGWSYAGGIAAWVAALHGTWRLGRVFWGDAARPAIAVALPALALALLVTHASAVAFATGGLETMLQTALLVQAAAELARVLQGQHAAAAPLGLLLGAALLTRPDSALPAALFAVFAGRALARGAGRAGVLRLLVPCAALVVPWLWWKVGYYGALLPNTYAAKVRWSSDTLAAGALYVWRYLHAYFLWPWIAVLGAASAARLASSRHSGAGPASLRLVLLITVACWWAYLAAVGGDFMEFRMLVPVAPFFFLLLVDATRALYPREPALVGGILLLVLASASLRHTRSFRELTDDRRLDSVPALATFYGVYPNRDWSSIGTALGRQLGGTGTTLALHAVGAIPYYSRLATLDMYGLNDREIARTGLVAPPHYRRPGHQRQVTLAEMRRRGVNLVLGHPTSIGRGALANPASLPALQQWVRECIGFGTERPGLVTLASIPIPNRPNLLGWILTPSPALATAAREHGWETATIEVRR